MGIVYRLQSLFATSRSGVFWVLLLTAACFAVTLGGERTHAAPVIYTVTNTNDAGAGSLREAITQINANPVLTDINVINFAIPGAGVHTINVASALPDIQRPVTIDGLTQPGASCSTQLIGTLPTSTVNAHTILVEITGADSALNFNHAQTQASTIKGLSLYGARNGGNAAKMIGVQANNLTIDCMHIGYRADGLTEDTATTYGIFYSYNTPATISGARLLNSLVTHPASGYAGVIVNVQPGVELIDMRMENNLVGVNAAGQASSTACGASVQGVVFGVMRDSTVANNVFCGRTAVNEPVNATIEGNHIGVSLDGMSALSALGSIALLVGGPGQSSTNAVVRDNTIQGQLMLNQANGARIENNKINMQVNGVNSLVQDPIAEMIFINFGTNVVLRDNVIASNKSALRVGGVTGLAIHGNHLNISPVSGQVPTLVTPASPQLLVSINNSTAVRIGSSAASDRNYMVGVYDAVAMISSGSDVAIKGNYFNTNLDASQVRSIGGSLQASVALRIADVAGDTVIGGVTAAEGNVFGTSASVTAVSYSDPTTSNSRFIVQNNFIGVSPNGDSLSYSGTVPAGLPPEYGGIMTIGSTPNAGVAAQYIIGTPGAGNTIAGAVTSGISVSTGGAEVSVQANNVGVTSSGTAMGGAGNGVYINATGGSSVAVGGTGAGEANTIMNNAANGVTVASTTTAPVSVRGNQIAQNTGIGIDLGADGVTANDANESDTGANGLQNYPSYTAMTQCDGTEQGMARLQSAPNTQYTLDFYGNTNGGVSAGEGRTYLGSATLTTDASGVGYVPGPQGGSNITVTATAPNGATSEFSREYRPISATGCSVTETETINTSPNILGGLTSTNFTPSNVTVEINGTQYPATFANNTWSIDENVINALPVGVYDVTVRFIDAVSTLADSYSIQNAITVQRADADQATVTSVASNDGRPIISGTYDSANATGFTVTVAERTYTLGQDTNLTTNGDTWTLDLSNIATPLAEGSYEVTTSTQTRAGGTVADASTGELTVVQSAAAPAPTPVAPKQELAETGQSAQLVLMAVALLTVAGAGLAYLRRG